MPALVRALLVAGTHLAIATHLLAQETDIEVLVRELGSDDYPTREAAEERLIERGFEEPEAVRRALERAPPDLEVERRRAQIFEEIPEDSVWASRRARVLEFAGKTPHSFELVHDPWLLPWVELVCDSPTLDSKTFDPVRLVRAVNELVALGKDRALRVLRLYQRAASASRWDEVEREFRFPGGRRVPFDRVRLAPILCLLFIPPPGREPPGFPEFDLEIQDDIPFLAGGYARRECDPVVVLGPHVSFCEERCTFRDRPLIPAVSPIQAAENLLAGPRQWIGGAPPEGLGESIRAQALRAVANLGPGADRPVWSQERQQFEQGR